MKSKIAKHVAVGITLIFAGLVAVIISAGKAVANKPKTPRTRAKRASATKVVKTQATPTKVISKKTTAVEKVEPKTEPKVDETSEMKKILSSTTGLKPKVLKLGLQAYNWAKSHDSTVDKKYLTIVDFSIPSKEKRMWVINLNTDKVVLNTLVANGKGSGLYKGVRFSNRPGSLESSLGVYVTGATYVGGDGLSMHVHGLQPGINSNAYSRTIEFHGAWYVSPQFAAAHGRVGRSWGCFALNKAILPKVVDTIRGGSVVFAYANDNSSVYAPYKTA